MKWSEEIKQKANSSRPTEIRSLRRSRPSANRDAVSPGDILTLLRLCWSAPCAWFLPQRLWPIVCRFAARFVELISPGKHAPTIARIAAAYGISEAPHAKHMAMSLAAARYELAFQVLRGFRPGGWNPEIKVEGLEMLVRALRNGRGAILWTVHFVFAPNVVKMAMHKSGHPMTHLSRPEHGFSKTRFGIRLLNPIRVKFENRYLEQRLVLDKERPGNTLLGARDVLSRNGIVSTTAGAWEGSRIVESNFLGGRIQLAGGPIWLAKQSGAALIPAIGVKIETPDRFLVRLLEPIDLQSAKDETEMNIRATADFLTAQASMILKYPDQWRGWSSLAAPYIEA